MAVKKYYTIKSPEDLSAFCSEIAAGKVFDDYIVSLESGDLVVEDVSFDVETLRVNTGTTFTVKGESSVKTSVFGDVSFAGDVTLADDSAINVSGDVFADGDLTFKYNAITGADNFTVIGVLNITDVVLPVDGSVTLLEGNCSFGSLVINGTFIGDDTVFKISDGDKVDFYEVKSNEAGVSLSTYAYQEMSGFISSVAQTAGSYEFTVDAAIFGGYGDVYCMVSAWNSEGQLIGLADGLTITLPDTGLLTPQVTFKVTANDSFGNEFSYTTDAFGVTVQDHTAPVFVDDVKASVVDGKLQLSWNAYDNFGIDKFIVTINGKEEVIDAVGGEMTFAQTALSGKNTYSIVAVDESGLETEISGIYSTKTPAANLLENGTSQIATYYAEKGIVGYYTVNGDTTTWAPVWEWGNSDMWDVVAVGNFGSSSVEHDGLLLYNKTNHTFAAWHNLNDPSYEYESLCWSDGDFAVNSLVDFDGNGKDDVLIYAPGGNQKGSFGVVLDGAVYKDIWHIDLSTGEGAGTELINAGYFGAADGLDSLIIKRDGGYWFMHSNDSTFSRWDWELIRFADVEEDGRIVAVGDFSNDGIDDIVYCKDSGEVFIWENADADNVRFAGNLGSDWEVAGVGDYNGDGIEDLLTRQIGAYGNIGYWGGAVNANWTNLGTGIKNDKENDDVVTVITASR